MIEPIVIPKKTKNFEDIMLFYQRKVKSRSRPAWARLSGYLFSIIDSPCSSKFSSQILFLKFFKVVS